jgi:phytanoyl-CoA dioxygenase PhyH
MTIMLTAEQRASFAAEGLVKLPAALDPDDAQQMCDGVWTFLAAKHGIGRDDASTWTTARPTGFNRLSRSGALDHLWSPTVHGVLSELLGTEDQHRERPRVLMTFPQPDVTWEVPRAAWHFDFTPRQDQAGLPAVQVFALLSDVRPQGGGTLVLSGSHELVSRYVARTGREPKPRLVRGDLAARHPWLAELWGDRKGEAAHSDNRSARLLGVTAVVDDIELRLTEATGRPGDVYIMNSDCFHTIAPNTLTVPRVMCTSLVIRSLQA